MNTMSFACGCLHALSKLSWEDYRRVLFNETTRRFFKPTTTTSEEKSATESTDATEKQENMTSCSESEEDEKNEEEETLKEKIDRLALESSDEDEDFDVSNRITEIEICR